MTPQQYVQDKAAKSGSSFYYAFLFLPPPRRAAITAFYAFCREVDDVVDEISDPSVAATKLAMVAQGSGRGLCRPAHPPGDAGADAAGGRLRASTRRAPERGDRRLPDRPGADPLSRLSPACSATAIWWPASWGEVAANIFGRSQAATVQYAHQLGLAMQLTNIIRDVGDDARRGRIYLP